MNPRVFLEDSRHALIEGTALVTAVGAAACVAAGTVALARGETPGAPGITKGLSRIGRAVGGSMLAGIAVIGGCAAVVGLGIYHGLRYLDM